MRTLHCPNCGTPFVRATSKEGTVERLLGRFNMLPFRCQLCTNRFRAFCSGARQSSQEFDRRQFKRLPASIDARVLDEKQLPFTNRITDISMDGCTLMMTGLSKGAFLELILKPTSEEEAIRIETAMVCSVRPVSVGLRFLEVNEPDRRRLSQVVLGLLVSQSHHPTPNA
jgi:c-di-GMP-binding flagellar brake protein YcgR